MSAPSSTQPASIAIIGCGWLGTPLAETLIVRGHRVLATRSTPEGIDELRSKGIEAIQLALRPNLECDRMELLHGNSLAVILLPPRARTGCGEQFPERISNLIAGLKSTGIHRCIFTSSTSVYPSKNSEVDENGRDSPDTESGRLLLEAEKRILLDPDVQTTIVRFAGLCGPGREPGRLLAGKKNLAGGDNPVNLIHQQDAIELLLTVMRHQPWGEVFNGCAPGHPARSILYPKAAKSMGLVAPVFSGVKAAFKLVRADKISRHLGFEYRFPDPGNWKW